MYLSTKHYLLECWFISGNGCFISVSDRSLRLLLVVIIVHSVRPIIQRFALNESPNGVLTRSYELLKVNFFNVIVDVRNEKFLARKT